MPVFWMEWGRNDMGIKPYSSMSLGWIARRSHIPYEDIPIFGGSYNVSWISRPAASTNINWTSFAAINHDCILDACNGFHMAVQPSNWRTRFKIPYFRWAVVTCCGNEPPGRVEFRKKSAGEKRSLDSGGVGKGKRILKPVISFPIFGFKWRRNWLATHSFRCKWLSVVFPRRWVKYG